MKLSIHIEADISDKAVLDSIEAVLDNTLPYMADNVEVAVEVIES